MKKLIRVLIVDDSLTVREHLRELMAADPDLEVVGTAADGITAVHACKSLRPDVMTLDLVLPGMSGLAATEHIMAWCPTPIVIVSSSSHRGDAFQTFDALAAGAVEVFDKPQRGDAARDWETRLLATVKLVSRIKVLTHLRGKRRGEPPLDAPLGRAVQAGQHPDRQVVAIGTSTGGPAALLAILKDLAPHFRLPILLVVHITPHFALPFVDWLGGHSPVPVAYARHGQRLPPPGQPGILMAPPDQHLTLEGDVLQLSGAPERHHCRPSVDVLFESLARFRGDRVVGCLLTGMGRDGAAGLMAIRTCGGMTFAQDEATSAVFGMPKEAIDLGAARRVLPLPAIAGALNDIAAASAHRIN